MNIYILAEAQNERMSVGKNGHTLLKDVLLKINFQDKGHLYFRCLLYILTIYVKCFLFQFLGRGIRIHIPILTPVRNGRISSWWNFHILLKKLLVKLNFQNEGDLYANSLIFVLFIFCKCLLFWFLSRGIRLLIPILTPFSNGCLSSWRVCHIVLKNVLLKLIFQNEGH